MTANAGQVRSTGTDTAALRGEQNKAIMREFIEQGFDAGNPSVVDQFFAANFKEHQGGVMPPTREGVKNLIRQVRTGLQDFHCAIEDMTADGDMVWVRLRGGGTHQAPLFGIPASGRTVTIDILDVCRFEDGKIVEHWGSPDIASLMQQVGALPHGVRQGGNPPTEKEPAPGRVDESEGW